VVAVLIPSEIPAATMTYAERSGTAPPVVVLPPVDAYASK
jgi:hypothetical protein